MNRLPMSPAAAALLRCLIARARTPRDRILLIGVESVDWRSLTFTGERHRFELRIAGPASRAAVASMCDGLEDAEFNIAGLIVTDVALVGAPAVAPDGSTTLTIEALTIEAD